MFTFCLQKPPQRLRYPLHRPLLSCSQRHRRLARLEPESTLPLVAQRPEIVPESGSLRRLSVLQALKMKGQLGRGEVIAMHPSVLSRPVTGPAVRGPAPLGPPRGLPQRASHAKGGFVALIVAGHPHPLPIPHPFVKGVRAIVARPYFQDDPGDAGDPGGLFEPLQQATTHPLPLTGVVHAEQIQVRLLRAVPHDPKARDPIRDAGDEHIGFGMTKARHNAPRSPGPGQAGLN